jgi:hypothetical protein
VNEIEPPAKRFKVAPRLLPVEGVLVDDDAACLETASERK